MTLLWRAAATTLTSAFVVGGCTTNAPTPTPTAFGTTSKPSPVHHSTSLLSPAQRHRARRLVVQSALVKRIADGAAITPGTVAPVTGIPSDDAFQGVVVTLHFSKPVTLLVGTPVLRHFPEDFDTSHLSISELTEPLARHVPANSTWAAEMNLVTGQVFLITSTP
jgi:hypothetical protein